MHAPSTDPFYALPVIVPTSRGAVVRARPVSLSGLEPCAATQIVYTTTATDAATIPVSGTVLVPEAPWRGPGARPIVSYGVGVHGLGRDNAPSYLLATGAEWEVGFIDLALARGWSVAITDGEGLGMPGPHTYGAGHVGGRAMLDIVRAAVDGIDGVDAPAPVLLWGYSEGGRCAAWAAEHQPHYARELPLVALAAGGAPTDLAAVVEAIDGGPYSGLGLAVLVGLAHAHADAGLWEILNPRGRAAAEVAATLDVGGLISAHPEPMATWTVRDEPWLHPAWRAVLRAERNPGGTPRVPVYLYHARGDDIVPISSARQLASTYQAMGVPVTSVELDSTDHLSGAIEGAADAVDWLARRLEVYQRRWFDTCDLQGSAS